MTTPPKLSYEQAAPLLFPSDEPYAPPTREQLAAEAAAIWRAHMLLGNDGTEIETEAEEAATQKRLDAFSQELQRYIEELLTDPSSPVVVLEWDYEPDPVLSFALIKAGYAPDLPTFHRHSLYATAPPLVSLPYRYGTKVAVTMQIQNGEIWWKDGYGQPLEIISPAWRRDASKSMEMLRRRHPEYAARALGVLDGAAHVRRLIEQLHEATGERGEGAVVALRSAADLLELHARWLTTSDARRA